MRKILLSITTFLLLLTSCKKEPEITYSKVGITKLTILAFKDVKDNGSTWDALVNTFPDVYFDITEAGTNNILFTASNRFSNLKSSDLPASWTGNSNQPFFTLNNLNQSVDIDLWDFDDVGSDEFMGTVTFNFRNYTSGSNKYPASATVSSGGITIKLDLTWSN